MKKGLVIGSVLLYIFLIAVLFQIQRERAQLDAGKRGSDISRPGISKTHRQKDVKLNFKKP